MDMVNVYTYVEDRGLNRSDRQAGYILELEREGGNPVTLVDFTVIENATNRQAQIRVLSAALERMTKPAELCIYEACGYVSAGFVCGWVKEWKANGWLTKQKKPVANVEDWKRLDGLLGMHLARCMQTERHPYSGWLEREVTKRAQAHRKTALHTEGA